MKTKWALEEIENEETGHAEITLVRYQGGNHDDGKTRPLEREEMGSVAEFVRLFKACQNRWSEHGWDIEKLITCVNECSFD